MDSLRRGEKRLLNDRTDWTKKIESKRDCASLRCSGRRQTRPGLSATRLEEATGGERLNQDGEDRGVDDYFLAGDLNAESFGDAG